MEGRELMKQLRVCADRSFSCGACPFRGCDNCVDGLLKEAANFIEKAEKKRNRTFRPGIPLEDAINTYPYLFSPYIEREYEFTVWRRA